MKIFQNDISIINSFLNNFKPIFSNKQFSAFSALCYALLKNYKRFNLSSAAKNLNINYQRLQYFLSDSKWNPQLLNSKRIYVLGKQRTTGFSKNGVLSIDDTGNRKPYALHTDGAQIQHCPSSGINERCNIAVSSCFVNNNKHVPLNLKFYQTRKEFSSASIHQFKDKLELASDLVDDALNKNIPFSHVVFDSWYGSSDDFLHSINDRNLKFISEIRSNRRFRFKHPVSKRSIFIQQDELVTLIKKYFWHKCRTIKYKGKYIPAFSFKTHLKGSNLSLNAFCIIGKFNEEDSFNAHIFITNDFSLSASKTFFIYRQRWGIEKSFRELKDSFCFDQYQLRHKPRIMRWWLISILVWSLVYWIKQNAYLFRILKHQPQTFQEYKQALLNLILFSSYSHLSKNKSILDHFFSDITSQRFKMHYQ